MQLGHMYLHVGLAALFFLFIFDSMKDVNKEDAYEGNYSKGFNQEI